LADLTPHAADGGLLSSAVTQVGTALVGAGVLWRLFVSFGRQDRAAKMEAELREELRQRLDQTQRDLDRIAHERNEAVQVRLQLETKLSMTEERLAATRQERDDARTALARMQGDVERLVAENHRLHEDAAIAEARGEPGIRPAPRQVPGERPWTSR